jgi:hypothetical protein
MNKLLFMMMIASNLNALDKVGDVDVNGVGYGYVQALLQVQVLDPGNGGNAQNPLPNPNPVEALEKQLNDFHKIRFLSLNLASRASDSQLPMIFDMANNDSKVELLLMQQISRAEMQQHTIGMLDADAPYDPR